MGCLNYFWRWLSRLPPRGTWHSQAAQEVWLAVASFPLAFADLRTQVSEIVTVSDASPFGGGVCVARRLTLEGEVAASHIQSCDDSASKRSVLLISLFDGIGGARRAWELLGLPLAAYISSEVDKSARRVVKRAWPEAIDWGDVHSITSERVRDLRVEQAEAQLVILCAGFPCQGESRLNADRQGLRDPRTALFWEVIRIRQLLIDGFGASRVHFLFENVASGLPQDILTFNAAIGVLPYE
eukprot:6397415-Amphidinium_carterae.1